MFDLANGKQFVALSVLFAHLVAKGRTINEKYESQDFDINILDDLAVCLYRNQDISFEDMFDLVAQLTSGNLGELYREV